MSVPLNSIPEYSLWKAMRQRCNYSRGVGYKYHGGRGIKVCERWSSFYNFIEDMGPRPSKEHSLDRIDNDGDYSPENCRWANPREQQNNMRRNRRFVFNGETHTLMEWSRLLDVSYSLLRNRIIAYGWSVERAFTERRYSRQEAIRFAIDASVQSRRRRAEP